MTGPLLVTAYLSSPLAGEPPQLDSLFEWMLAPFEPEFREKQNAGIPHYRIDRALPAPAQGVIRIPIERAWLGGFLVARCSDPIIPVPCTDSVDHICKRVAVEHAGLLDAGERKILSTTNSWTKSYRLPLRVRNVDRVCWFTSGNRRNVQKTLRDAHAIGKKVADGYGRVKEWTVDDIAEDWTWFAKHDERIVLMRTLPLMLDGRPWLPESLFGWKKHYGACCPPYWHPSRFSEICVPI